MALQGPSVGGGFSLENGRYGHPKESSVEIRRNIPGLHTLPHCGAILRYAKSPAMFRFETARPQQFVTVLRQQDDFFCVGSAEVWRFGAFLSEPMRPDRAVPVGIKCIGVDADVRFHALLLGYGSEIFRFGHETSCRITCLHHDE